MLVIKRFTSPMFVAQITHIFHLCWFFSTWLNLPSIFRMPLWKKITVKITKQISQSVLKRLNHLPSRSPVPEAPSDQVTHIDQALSWAFEAAQECWETVTASDRWPAWWPFVDWGDMMFSIGKPWESSISTIYHEKYIKQLFVCELWTGCKWWNPDWWNIPTYGFIWVRF